MSSDSRINKPCAAGVPLKKYETPRLRGYGNIREITQNAGAKGNPDNVMNKKTSM